MLEVNTKFVTNLILIGVKVEMSPWSSLTDGNVLLGLLDASKCRPGAAERSKCSSGAAGEVEMLSQSI